MPKSDAELIALAHRFAKNQEINAHLWWAIQMIIIIPVCIEWNWLCFIVVIQLYSNVINARIEKKIELIWIEDQCFAMFKIRSTRIHPCTCISCIYNLGMSTVLRSQWLQNTLFLLYYLNRRRRRRKFLFLAINVLKREHFGKEPWPNISCR